MTNIKIKANFDFSKLSGNLVGEITKIGLFNSSEEAIDRAREKAPYQTGNLKKSIAREPMNISKSTRKVVVGPRKVAYAERREFENFKNPDKKYYMKKTFQELPDFVEQEFNKATEIVLKRNGLK